MRTIRRSSRNTRLARGRWERNYGREQAASGKLRQIPEDIPLERELPEELLESPELPETQADVDEPETGLGTLGGEKSKPDWQAEQRDAPTALKKLRNSFK